MQGLFELIEEKKKDIEEKRAKKTAKSERQEVLSFFYEKLLPEWKSKNRLTPCWLAMNTSHLKLQDLYYLKSICLSEEKRGQVFSKIFWGSLKSKS